MRSLFILLCVMPFAGIAQEVSKEEKPLSYFMVTYSRGENWNDDLPYHEQAYFSEHSDQLSSWRKSGKIKMGGRYDEYGLIFIQASSEASAREVLQGDPSVQNGIFQATIVPFEPFYNGCIE